MEFFDYDDRNEEYDIILAAADPCEDCGSKDGLALIVITSEEMFGHMLILCTNCHTEEEDFPVEQEQERVYA